VTAFSSTGTYNLIGYSGSIKGSGTSKLYVGNRVAGMRYTFGTAASEVTLTVAQGPLWDGAANGNFNDGNWGAGLTLQANDNLAFAGSNHTAVTNDTAAGTAYAGITFMPSADVFTLGGSSVTLTDNIVNNSPNAQTINLPMTMAGLGGRTINAAAGPIVTGALGTIANGGNTLTVTGSSNITLGGAVGGSGGLTMAGAGILALNAANGYSGATNIVGGELLVNGSLLSPVTVSGGTLGGTGSLRSVTAAVGGQIAPGNPLGTLSISGTLTLSGGAALDYELDSPSTSSKISCGYLALGDQQFSDFHFTWSPNFGPGNYDLIHFGSSSGTLSVSGMIDNLPATLGIQGKDVVLTVVPEPSTFALLDVGAISLIAYAWRRRKHTA